MDHQSKALGMRYILGSFIREEVCNQLVKTVSVKKVKLFCYKVREISSCKPLLILCKLKGSFNDLSSERCYHFLSLITAIIFYLSNHLILPFLYLYNFSKYLQGIYFLYKKHTHTTLRKIHIHQSHKENTITTVAKYVRPRQ